MISQFYILSPRGDTIVNRDFRGDIVKGTAEIFFRKVKFWGTDAPPIFNFNGINYIYIKRNDLFFVFTTYYNIPPSYAIELLQRMTKVFKDFCGVLNEECIRKNFVLIYELLDEMLDFGYPQMTQTETLKPCVHNEAVLADNHINQRQFGGLRGFGASMQNPRTVPSIASNRPVGSIKSDNTISSSSFRSYCASLSSFSGSIESSNAKQKNEIFVDILERLTVVLNNTGSILNASIDGSIQMKSYLSGSPELKLALNDIYVCSDEGPNYSMLEKENLSSTILDDCNFHDCVDLKDFDELKILSFNPPDGEFILMNYRITKINRIPFRIMPVLQILSLHKIEILIKIWADMPEQNYSANVMVYCPLPKHTLSVSIDKFPNNNSQIAEFVPIESRIVWSIKKFIGGTENSIRCRVNASQNVNLNFAKKDIGPISMQFEIPMHNVSNLSKCRFGI